MVALGISRIDKWIQKVLKDAILGGLSIRQLRYTLWKLQKMKTRKLTWEEFGKNCTWLHPWFKLRKLHNSRCHVWGVQTTHICAAVPPAAPVKMTLKNNYDISHKQYDLYATCALFINKIMIIDTSHF